MIKKLLLVTIAFFAGVFIYMHTHGISIITQATNVANTLTNIFQPIITPIQNVWASMPESVRGITIAGIPTLFMVFFAWSKNRAMQKLEQTKLQASQQITQVVGEASETKGKLETKLQTALDEKQKLQDQVTSIPQQFTQQITDLTEERDKWKERFEKLQAEYNWASRKEAEAEQFKKVLDPRKHVD